MSDGRDILDSIVTRNRVAGVESLIYTTVSSCSYSLLILETSAALQPITITIAL